MKMLVNGNKIRVSDCFTSQPLNTPISDSFVLLNRQYFFCVFFYEFHWLARVSADLQIWFFFLLNKLEVSRSGREISFESALLTLKRSLMDGIWGNFRSTDVPIREYLGRWSRLPYKNGDVYLGRWSTTWLKDTFNVRSSVLKLFLSCSEGPWAFHKQDQRSHNAGRCP